METVVLTPKVICTSNTCTWTVLHNYHFNSYISSWCIRNHKWSSVSSKTDVHIQMYAFNSEAM